MASNDVLAKLASLRHQFQQRLPNDIERLAELWDNWIQRGEDADRQALLRQLHTLKGNSGTFGFSALSAQAAQLEAALDARQRNQTAAESVYSDLMVELRAAITQVNAADEAAPDPTAGAPDRPA